MGYSMLNNIIDHGLTKSRKVNVLNIPGTTSRDIVDKIDNVLEGKPKSLIVHIDMNDLTNNVNIFNNCQ